MEENKKTQVKKETVKKTTAKKTQTKEKENIASGFSPEMVKQMYEIFKQFQSIENQEKSIINNSKEKPINSNEKFTKVMLTEIEDEKVVVKSAIDGLVIFKSPKTLIKYKWPEKGDVEVMTIKEVLTMENESKRFLHTPWVTIEDERIIEALGLEKLYEKIEKVEDIPLLLELSPDEIRKIFNDLPKNYKDNFRDEIYMKVKSNELRDVLIINTLSDILGINLLD